MLKVAITGNIGSGKSAVEEIITAKGFRVVDTDKIAHEILAESDTVKKMFAQDDILTEGEIDRKKLGAVVFNDSKKLKLLELIIHPQVVTELLKIFQGDEEIIFVSVPQLFEAGFEDMFDKIIYVFADEETRAERIMKRNGFSHEEAVKRISSQKPDSEKTGLCDFVINNTSTKAELKKQTEKVLSSIC